MKQVQTYSGITRIPDLATNVSRVSQKYGVKSLKLA